MNNSINYSGFTDLLRDKCGAQRDCLSSNGNLTITTRSPSYAIFEERLEADSGGFNATGGKPNHE